MRGTESCEKVRYARAAVMNVDRKLIMVNGRRYHLAVKILSSVRRCEGARPEVEKVAHNRRGTLARWPEAQIALSLRRCRERAMAQRGCAGYEARS